MRIGDFDLDHDVYVVAEIGNNHEGDPGLAAEMIGLAADAGVNAVKFQMIVPDELVTPDQVERMAQLQRFALSADTFRVLASVAAAHGVDFLCTPFSPSVVPLIAELGPAIKIASADNDYVSLLRTAARTGKPILLSTGMSDLDGVRTALQVIESAWDEERSDPGLAVLHCVSAYPTPNEQANLAAIRSLAEFGRPVGYSDHTLSIDAAVLSVGFGARVVEKHFTISKTFSPFRDHALSADPSEMAELVKRVRTAVDLVGDGVKRFMPDERQVADSARRSLAVVRDLPAGHVLRAEDLCGLRPPRGIAVGRERQVVGRELAHAVKARALLLTDDLR